MNGGARETGPALEAHYRFLLWLVPTVERFPRGRKFLPGDRGNCAGCPRRPGDLHAPTGRPLGAGQSRNREAAVPVSSGSRPSLSGFAPLRTRSASMKPAAASAPGSRPTGRVPFDCIAPFSALRAAALDAAAGVDLSRHDGASLWAANWQLAGKSAGRAARRSARRTDREGWAENEYGESASGDKRLTRRPVANAAVQPA